MSHTTAAGGRCVRAQTMSDESDSTIELNRRRVLSGLGVIGLASAGAGAGTMALFSDTETSSGNTVQAGTLDLTPDSSGSQTLTIIDSPDGSQSGSGIEPGDSGSGSVEVTNSGSLDGYLDINTGDFKSNENTVDDPETGATGEDGSASWASAGTKDGELHEELEVDVTLSSDVTGVSDQSLTSGYTDLEDAFGANTEYDVDYPMPDGATTTVTVDWRLPSGTRNKVQSDSVEVEFVFELGQETSQ